MTEDLRERLAQRLMRERVPVHKAGVIHDMATPRGYARTAVDALIEEINAAGFTLVDRRRWCMVYVDAIEDYTFCELTPSEQERAAVKPSMPEKHMYQTYDGTIHVDEVDE